MEENYSLVFCALVFRNLLLIILQQSTVSNLLTLYGSCVEPPVIQGHVCSQSDKQSDISTAVNVHWTLLHLRHFGKNCQYIKSICKYFSFTQGILIWHCIANCHAKWVSWYTSTNIYSSFCTERPWYFIRDNIPTHAALQSSLTIISILCIY